MALRYFRSTGTNWGTAGDWSSTPSPTYTAGAVPLVTDDVVFEAASANCIVNASARVCKSITFTNYTNTITFTFNVSVAGNVTLGASMGIAGTGILIVTATSTLTPNSKVWTGNFGVQYATAFTITLAADFIIEGTFSHLSGSVAAMSFNGFTLTFKGNLSFSTSAIGGTTNVIIAPPIGTTKTAISSGIQINNSSLEFNGAGTFNFTNLTFGGTTIKYTNGSFNQTSGTFTISNLTVSLDTVGMSFNAMAINTNFMNITLLSDINCRGNFYVQAAVFLGAFNVNVSSITAASGGCSGGTIVFRSGTTHLGVTYSAGTWNGTVTNYSSNIVIAGNPTITNTGISGGSFTYTSGTPIFNGTFQLSGTVTLNLSGMAAFNSLTISTASIATANITNNALFTVNGIMTNTHSISNQTINWLGSAGWSTANLLNSFAGGTLVLASGVTYTVRSQISFTGGTFAVRPLIRASLVNSTKAILTLDFGATQSLIYVNATDIDSSGGQTIWSFGVLPVTNLLRTINWNPGVPLRTVVYTFVT